ncbi:uroporphyrinogen-III C-methyltransferase [Alphaproteobacteria bacterium]|jgi:uroporphyrin-III C-methyltransferase|nr:uroporphyrinogen-III C-methyltransferase [Rhodospirillaceae bacterium]MDC0998542.1 uroporphyrinogen-III C-methyltransferase [Alphaproteobacteria bacterium]MBT5912316.1 uroporphyrinogen-III C-methyltransferase [Rhodospirillaceae bacterium]MBT6307610.1 uroporphyrinogen-III C-methyltransferase [Rhodospirillaceae bacterium]MBT7730643.1 uroporphyrinogen-III C-methyltransferase [Rhodospirillaceae bacterium]|tara:strand:- start:177 stop:1010 length:834 start_codon:yes stop_codon:yes gene_type:complete
MKNFATKTEFKPGTVWLAGAGPGDPGLLTLHTLHALDSADVIVFDALVSDPILDLAPEHTPREFAGKRGGKPSYKQVDISLRIIQLARQGKRVLRLKGGDPFVFGRGGEEAAALVSAGIPFRIIPGITAGIGGLAYAGIPLTHRDTNQAVTLVTGHDATGKVSRIDWKAISDGSPVIVIYMAMKHIEKIVQELRRAGRQANEPMAFVCNASMPNQTVLETTLGTCLADIKTSNIKPPSIVVVGDVVNLREGLDWLGAEEGRVLINNIDTGTIDKKTG